MAQAVAVVVVIMFLRNRSRLGLAIRLPLAAAVLGPLQLDHRLRLSQVETPSLRMAPASPLPAWVAPVAGALQAVEQCVQLEEEVLAQDQVAPPIQAALALPVGLVVGVVVVVLGRVEMAQPLPARQAVEVVREFLEWRQAEAAAPHQQLTTEPLAFPGAAAQVVIQLTV
jgi:hypothetical protein